MCSQHLLPFPQAPPQLVRKPWETEPEEESKELGQQTSMDVQPQSSKVPRFIVSTW